jgi:hypothetical protein
MSGATEVTQGQQNGATPPPDVQDTQDKQTPPNAFDAERQAAEQADADLTSVLMKQAQQYEAERDGTADTDDDKDPDKKTAESAADDKKSSDNKDKAADAKDVKADKDGDKKPAADEKPRNDKGQFTSKDSDGKTADNQDGSEPATDKGASPEKPDPSAVSVPRSWAPEMAEHFAKSPKEVQEYVAKREEEAQTRLSDQGRFISHAQPVIEAVLEFDHAFKTKGITHADGVRTVLEVQQMLDTDPVAGLMHIAGKYGVNIADVAYEMELGIAPDPEKFELQQRVARQEQREQHQQQQTQTVEQMQNQFAVLVQKMAAEKPDFNDLLDVIEAEWATIEQSSPQLIQADMGAALQLAYDRAKLNGKPNPTPEQKTETTEEMVERLVAERLAEERTKGKKAADEAANVNAINVGVDVADGLGTQADLNDVLLAQATKLLAA